MPSPAGAMAKPAAKPRARANAPAPSYKVARRSGPSIDWAKVAILAGGIGCVVGAAFLGGYALRHSQSGLPVIAADPGPVRVKPDSAGGADTIGEAGVLPVSSDGDTLAPQAEPPAVAALRDKFTPKVAQVPPVPEAPRVTTVIATLIERMPPLVSTAEAETTPPPAPAGTLGTSALPTVVTPVTAAAGKVIEGISIQIAALDSPAAANAHWDATLQKYHDLMAGRPHSVAPARVAGKEVWRLRVGGFADVAEASGFCAKFRAAGGACTVAAF